MADFFDILRQGATFGKKSKGTTLTTANAITVSSPNDLGGRRLTTKRKAEATESGNVEEDVKVFKAVQEKTDMSEDISLQESEEAREKRIHTEAVNAFRNKHKIHVYDCPGSIPEPFTTFNVKANPCSVPGMFVNPPSCLTRWVSEKALTAKFENPTAVQSQVIPLMCGGHHVLAQAPTGSGKTLAFLLPILHLLQKPAKDFGRALIVDPTRELANQTVRECQKIVGIGGKFRVGLLDQVKAKKDPGEDSKSAESHLPRLDLAVSTPLRLVQLLKDGRISLSACKIMVFDEADKLLDLGFAPQIDEILTFARDQLEAEDPLQLCMFSATLSSEVTYLANSVLMSPVKVAIGAPLSANSQIKQSMLFCGQEDGKLLAVRQLAREGKIKPPTLIFCQSVQRAKELCSELLFDGLFVDMIHAERSKAQRDGVIDAFRRGKIWVLICTDLMARGVDFKGVELVINFDVPQSSATYIHRVGRTGRAGRQGEAITLFTLDDKPYLRGIVTVLKSSGCEVPSWLDVSLPKGVRVKVGKGKGKFIKKNVEFHPPKRKKISTEIGRKLKRKRNTSEGAKKA